MSDKKMTEIEQIKTKVELILNDDSGGSWNKNHDSDYYAKLNLAKLELLEEDIPSLITTIESLQEQKEAQRLDYLTLHEDFLKQKEEIEKLKSWVFKLQDAHQIEQFNLRAEIESLKAITELAVKGLEWIETYQYSHLDDSVRLRNMKDLAKTALSEIERLSHE